MDNLHNRLTLDLGKKNKSFYYNQKEDPKISRIAEFGGEMLYNTKNIGLARFANFVCICITR